MSKNWNIWKSIHNREVFKNNIYTTKRISIFLTCCIHVVDDGDIDVQRENPTEDKNSYQMEEMAFIDKVIMNDCYEMEDTSDGGPLLPYPYSGNVWQLNFGVKMAPKLSVFWGY